MRNVFSIIWKVIAVAMICVGVYLLIQVLGEADVVIESYEQLTGNSIGATNSMKILFLREYISRTGDTDILVTIGISPEEAQIILKENLQPGESANPEDDRQQSGQGGSAAPGRTPNPMVSGNFQINYAPVTDDGLRQGYSNFGKLMGGKGSLKDYGCAVFSLYNAYLYNSSNPKHLEDILLEYEPNLTINSQGYLEGDLVAIGEGSSLWSYMVNNVTNPGSAQFNNTSNDGSISVDDKITSDGKYIIYYSHGDGVIQYSKKTGHTNCHWVYAERTGSSFKVYNTGGEGDNIGDRPIIRYYKIG